MPFVVRYEDDDLLVVDKPAGVVVHPTSPRSTGTLVQPSISAARIRRLYFGADDPKSGGVRQGPRVFSHPQAHHVPEIYDGIAAAAAADLLRQFFGTRR